MLEITQLQAGYAAGPVLHGIDLVVRPREIVTLIGANGAGKSTLVKTISGLLRAQAGRISWEGARIDTLSPAERVRRGIAHVPEGRQTFAGMTVRENLRLGAYVHRRGAGEAVVAERMRAVCDLFPVLGERMDETVGNFSGGQQQMLAIARGLMSDPRLLILDEPSLGLSPILVAEIFSLVHRLRESGVAILLSEQNARSALTIADRGYVIENGRIVLAGEARDLLESGDVAERYLGVGSADRIDRSQTQATAVRLRRLVWGE